MRRELTKDGWVVKEPEEKQVEVEQGQTKSSSKAINELKKTLKEASERAASYECELGRLEAFLREKHPKEVLFMQSDIVDVAIRLLSEINTESITEGTE